MEGVSYGGLTLVVVHGRGSLLGADPCETCTHYELDGKVDGTNTIESAAASRCTRGQPGLKYVAKSGTTTGQVNNLRMQIGSTNEAPNGNDGRWDYQSASECYAQDGTTDETGTYRCTRDRAGGACDGFVASIGDYDCDLDGDWVGCMVLPSSSPPRDPPPALPPASPPASPPSSPPPPPPPPPTPFYGALFGHKAGLDMTVYVAAGTGPSFEYDELTWVAVGVQFTVPYESMELLVPGPAPQAFGNDVRKFVGFAGIGGAGDLSYPMGALARFTWPAGTDMSIVAIDYSNHQKTYIEIDSWASAITFDTDPAPAFVVLSGESDTFKEVSVYAADGERAVRNTGLGFARDMSGELTAQGYSLVDGLQVSKYSTGRKVSWAVFTDPFLTPTHVPIGALELATPFNLSDIDMVESNQRL